MSRAVQLIHWFTNSTLSELLPDPAIIVGGTSLLREFLSRVENAEERSKLSVVAPFIGRGISDEIAAWRTMPHESIELSILTSTKRDAQTAHQEVGGFPWSSLSIFVRRSLHAKVYTLVRPNGGGACLIGSHNLTAAGARSNFEAGVLFVGSADPQVIETIQACDDFRDRLMKSSSIFIDSGRWPSRRVA